LAIRPARPRPYALWRWHNEWSAPREQGGEPRIAAARMAMTVLKAALSFGIGCRLPGCGDLKLILEQERFPAPRPCSEAPTAKEIIAARKAAHKLGHPLAALAYALQFEGAMRQWDVVGQWVPLSDQRPSLVIDGNQKWIGPTWAAIDDNLILRYTPSKTQFTTGARGTLDLRACPMVMEDIAGIPIDARRGPLIVNPRTGLPYKQWFFWDLWRRAANQAGIKATVWNRDLRAAAVTEGRQAGAPTDDVAKVATHASKRTTARVYDRDHLEAHRRVMKARVAHRGKDNDGE
jgi:hypothetical protein